jgi:putative multiple sugar transport system ATP-binding protein
MDGITKEFPGIKALNNVNFRVKPGEIHCLVGENGAGKSTLMKVLSGIYTYGSYEGRIVIDEQEQCFNSIRDSEGAGIAIISQELALIPELTVYENIFFGHEVMRGIFVNWNETIIRANELLKRVKLDVNPSALIADLRVGEQQLVEIAKTLSKKARIISLDEPTSSLNEEESRNLLELLRQLKRDGVTIVMISHRLVEVVSIADTITVLRDGATICSMDASSGEITEREIIKYMVGREIENIYPKQAHKRFDEICFELRDWSAVHPKTGRRILKDISFFVKKGEIVGIAGLMGAGRTELALSIFGNTPRYRLTSGEARLGGKTVSLGTPMKALDAGIAYMTEDRKKNGLVLVQNIKYNITLSNLKILIHNRFINENEEILVANQYKDKLGIRTTSIEQITENLSGGNQQKVSLAKLLFTKPKLLILDEPTRGIDVGAKFEIYNLINKMAAEGMSIILISSELAEIIGMSDRVYVMSEGAFTGELSRNEAGEHSIMELATNIKEIP